MAHISADRVKESTTTTGTGAVTLNGTSTGFRTFGSVMTSPSDTCWYTIAHQSADEWECGLGTYSAANTLTRTTVLSSSNSDAAVSFSAGTKDVFLSAIADRLPIFSPAQTIEIAALSSVPSAPPSGTLALYARLRANRIYLDVQGPSGRDYPVQPFLGLNRIVQWIPETSTTIRVLGMPVTSVGTVSTPTPASTNLISSMRRWRLTSAATANSASENRAAQLMVWSGNAAGFGGYTFVARIALTTLSTNCRGFFGLLNTTGAVSTSQVPSALTNAIGFTWDATETSFRIGSNDGSGTMTRVDLGASFPTTNTAAVYSMLLQCNPNSATVEYRIVREDTGSVADGTITTNLPSNTTFLTPHLYMNNGGDASAIAFDCAGVYIESDY